MSPTGPGGGPADVYAGPPPTLRPDAGQSPVRPWPPADGGAPPPVLWPPPPGSPPHDEPQPYLLAMRARDWAWWRPVAGLLLLALAALVVGSLLGVVGILSGVHADLSLTDPTDPAVLLLTGVAVAVALPVVRLAWAVAHGMRPGWSTSVLARLRWRLLPRFAAFALLAVGGAGALAAAADGTAGGDGPVASWGWVLAVVLLVAPVQAAAEEHLFRGYLSQAIAGWIGRRTAGAGVAAVLTAALFALVHRPDGLSGFLALVALGLAASAVVLLTGGLEATIALHAVTAVLLHASAVLGEGGGIPTGPAGAALGLAGLVLYVALVAWWRRRAAPETRTPAVDLRPSAETEPAG
ncbi:CPBP family intramembrane glutamic endopeptidase [Blastococcus xanthinilyticus]|uniref:CAAX prenyl protease 2/Lysostaphin resistance protein A-like domain-containing protein n=1 Tax=Blastococcus xanthinilyticus TaxID=1564164 RepID=A0A5S5CSR6_9ACTN|nr:CPBP family intramembrane glutamic endopeptidase [Blastococcus xanthinilyticus]TYP85978.1 hypothetical protein BD833_111119 [Blastococcus xanthinilyticus]